MDFFKNLHKIGQAAGGSKLTFVQVPHGKNTIFCRLPGLLHPESNGNGERKWQK